MYKNDASAKQITEFRGINLRDGCADGELALSENISFDCFPYLSPRKARRLHSQYTRPTALYAWGNLVVVDGTDLIYRGEVVGTVTAGAKQFAVVNTRLVVWPDKAILDLATGRFYKMERTLSATPGSAVFTGNKLTLSTVDPVMGSASETFVFDSDEPQMIKKYTGLAWADNTWTKTGETEATVKALAVNDLLIPVKSSLDAYSMNIKPSGGSYGTEDNDGTYLKVTRVTSSGTTECRWEKWNCAASYYNYYTQGSFGTVETGTSDSSVGGTSYAGYAGYTFNNMTGQFSSTGSYSALTGGMSGTVYQTGEGTICKKITYTRTGPTTSTYVAQRSYTQGPYTGVSYYKGNTSYGFVYGDEGAYPNNGRASDGYWYVLAGETGFEGTVTVEYELRGQGNRKFTSEFSVGDRVDITGCTTQTANNVKRAEIISVADYELTFANDTFTAASEAGTVSVQKQVPDLDFICSSGNRLWGVCNDTENEIWNAERSAYEEVSSRTIWASALGLPDRFYDYDGVSTDSYAVAVGTDGDFTGIIGYSGSVLCWKEDVLHRMTGDFPAAFYMYTYNFAGLEDGSAKSMVVINEILYYKGRAGIYAYSGNVPTLISFALGEERYTNAVGGAHAGKYYVSMRDEDGASVLFVYDSLIGAWLREDDLKVTDFAALDGSLYALADNAVWAMEEGTDSVEWSATLAEADEVTHRRKNYRWLRIRCRIPASATMTVETSTDGGAYQQVHSKTPEADFAGTINVPLAPNRCDRISVRLSGTGNVVIESVIREYNLLSAEV